MPNTKITNIPNNILLSFAKVFFYNRTNHQEDLKVHAKDINGRTQLTVLNNNFMAVCWLKHSVFSGKCRPVCFSISRFTTIEGTTESISTGNKFKIRYSNKQPPLNVESVGGLVRNEKHKIFHDYTRDLNRYHSDLANISAYGKPAYNSIKTPDLVGDVFGKNPVNLMARQADSFKMLLRDYAGKIDGHEMTLWDVSKGSDWKKERVALR